MAQTELSGVLTIFLEARLADHPPSGKLNPDTTPEEQIGKSQKHNRLVDEWQVDRIDRPREKHFVVISVPTTCSACL
jgi:hypothetical protein